MAYQVTYLDACRVFNEFGLLLFRDFQDMEETKAQNRPIVNVGLVKAWAVRKFGDYEAQGKMLEEVITEKYSKWLWDRFARLLP